MSFNVDVDGFSQQMKVVNERATTLYGRAGEPQQQPELLADSLEELRTALEELRVAEEKLRQQNDELAIAREAVEKERQRYQELFEFAPDGYLVTDSQGTIREANSAAATLFNLSQKFLVGKPLANFVPDEERPAFRYQLNRLHQLERLQEWEVRLRSRGGANFDAALSGACIRNWEGKLVGWRWLVRNITARKQAEAQMRNIQLQNLQLQEATRVKSQFLAIMSHELRTPMNAIIGFSQLLLRHPQDPLSPQQANMAERILKGGKHLLRLIDEILSFSKLEAGALELELEEFNLAELVTTAAEELRSLAEQKDLALQVRSSLHNPMVVNDATRLRQILTNLLANAIKFTESGSVEVDVWELSDDRVAIALKDTGIGIAQENLKHIFQEFWQLNQTTSRKHGGAGLGLAIVDRLVLVMKGAVTVTSRLGQGSTFQVELPRRVLN